MMNIKQALQMPITHVLEKMGCQPVKENGHDIWYHSPFRNEKTPSFHVHTLKNVWYDFGASMGGDIINLVTTYLKYSGEDHLIPDALRWIENMTVNIKPVQFHPDSRMQKNEPKLQVKSVSRLNHPGLILYLEMRGITLSAASKYLKELVVFNKSTNRRYVSLGFQNEEGGWEIRNPYFKGCVAPKSISFVRANHEFPKKIHVFEGFMDFLSCVTQNKNGCLDGDVIVLNSISCLRQVYPYIRDYSYNSLYSWLDNDDSGVNATNELSEFIKTQTGLTLHRMNNHYSGHKDVNAWHMKQRGLV